MTPKPRLQKSRGPKNFLDARVGAHMVHLRIQTRKRYHPASALVRLADRRDRLIIPFPRTESPLRDVWSRFQFTQNFVRGLMIALERIGALQRDLEKLLSHYTDETMVVIPGMPVAKNAESRRAAIRAA